MTPLRPGDLTDMMLFGGSATALLDRPDVIIVGEHAKHPTEELTADGSHVVKGIRIFKTGSFKDSRGVRREWDGGHLDLMVRHFQFLVSAGIFPNVPTRADHSGSVHSVCGYFRSIYRDPEDARFLAADIEFTEPAAYDKWKRGTFRSRSLEIGAYETNGGATYFPTVMGLAFVDIPAVEGLHSSSTSSALHFSHAVADQQEISNMDWLTSLANFLAGGGTAEQWSAACTFAAANPPAPTAPAWLTNLASFVQGGGTPEQWSAAAEFAQQQATLPPSPPPPPAPAPAPTVVPPAPAPGQHQAPAAFRFKVGGIETIDYAAVQARLDFLEGFVEDNTKAVRTDFVKKLVTDNKIPKTAEAAELALVETFSDGQFATYRAAKDATPASSLFGQYGEQGQQEFQQGQQGQPGFVPGDPGAKLDDLSTAEEIVLQHFRSGREKSFIEGTASFKKLVTAGRVPTELQ